MRIRIKHVAASLLILALTPLAASADAYDTATAGRRLWYGAGAAVLNVVPGVSILASQRCLPGYVACKIMFTGLGFATSGAQLFLGGDVDGARATVGRALGGDWVVTPRHLATGIKPDPYPSAARGDDEFDLP